VEQHAPLNGFSGHFVGKISSRQNANHRSCLNGKGSGEAGAAQTHLECFREIQRQPVGKNPSADCQQHRFQ